VEKSEKEKERDVLIRTLINLLLLRCTMLTIIVESREENLLIDYQS